MKLVITMLIHNKDDIEFVTEFPCFLGHPVPEAHIIELAFFEKIKINRSVEILGYYLNTVIYIFSKKFILARKID